MPAEVSAVTDQGTPGDPLSPRLLLVEDDQDRRAYLARLIAANGWAVHAVPTRKRPWPSSPNSHHQTRTWW